MKVYVSGPMTGLTDFNFPAFDAVSKLLRDAEHEVFSPADHDREVVESLWPGRKPEDFPGYAEGDLAGYFDAVSSHGEFTLDNMLKADLNFIANEADLLVCLPGWENSTGGRYERTVAEALNVKIAFATPSAELGDEGSEEWEITDDRDQKQITTFLRLFPSAEVLANVQITSPEAAAEAKQAIYDNGYQDALDEIAALTPEPVEVTSLAGQAHEFTTREHLAAARTGLSHVPGISQHFDRIEANLA